MTNDNGDLIQALADLIDAMSDEQGDAHLTTLKGRLTAEHFEAVIDCLGNMHREDVAIDFRCDVCGHREGWLIGGSTKCPEYACHGTMRS